MGVVPPETFENLVRVAPLETFRTFGSWSSGSLPELRVWTTGVSPPVRDLGRMSRLPVLYFLRTGGHRSVIFVGVARSL
jgi:hypothetical protein